MGIRANRKAKTDSINRLEIFDRSRLRLQAIAYRMLGSITDAEDMVQETFIKWQQASGQEIQYPQAYLTKIITRLCIDRLRSATVKRETYVGTWLPEPIVADRSDEPKAMIELADSLAMAFLLQGLIDLLAADITLWSDGGGKVKALLKPMQGVEKVARFLIALRRSKLIPNYDTQLAKVNGQIGVIYSLRGIVQNVVALEIVDRQIYSIYFVRNPDKLKYAFSQKYNGYI